MRTKTRLGVFIVVFCRCLCVCAVGYGHTASHANRQGLPHLRRGGCGQGRSRLAELAPVAALVMAFFGVLLWLIAAKMIFDQYEAAMKKALTLVLEDEAILELMRILMDDDEAAALAFLKEHFKGKARQLLEGG